MRKLIICSGAGLSAESGIMTFREAGGLWYQHDLEKVCTLSNFMDNYILINDFYNERRTQLKRVEPNDAHKKIAELEYMFEVINFTTNVDDLLERAGCSNVIHLHGKLTEIKENYGTDKEKVVDIGYNNSGYDNLEKYPLKPNVVFFGEEAPLYKKFEEEVRNTTPDDIMIIVGSSEQIFLYCYQAKYLYNFSGKIIFVNKDVDLCENYVLNKDVNEAHIMSAVKFFNSYNFDKLL